MGFVSELGLAPIIQREAERKTPATSPLSHRSNAWAQPPMPMAEGGVNNPAYGAVMSYKPRGFSKVLFSRGPNEVAAPDNGGKLTSAAKGLEKLTALAHSTENKNQTIDVAPVTSQEVAMLSSQGIEITSEFKHTADLYAVRHTLNRHGDASVEKKFGQLAITDADIKAVGEIIAAPDALVLGAKNPRKQDLVGYLKRLADGSILYFEEVRTGGKALAMASMRKYPSATDFEAIVHRIVPSYAQGDTGDVRIVYQNDQRSQGDTCLLYTSPSPRD